MKENKILFKSFRFIQAGLLIFVIEFSGMCSNSMRDTALFLRFQK